MSSNSRGSRSKKNIFSRAWKALKGKRGSQGASASQANLQEDSPVESRHRSSSASQSQVSSRKSSQKSSPVESQRRSSSSSQSDNNRYNSGEDDPWRASYRYGALAYPGDYDQGRVRSYPSPPRQDFPYSYQSGRGHYYSRGFDNFDSYVRDDAPVLYQPPPHTSYGYYRPSEDPNNCAVM